MAAYILLHSETYSSHRHHLCGLRYVCSFKEVIQLGISLTPTDFCICVHLSLLAFLSSPKARGQVIIMRALQFQRFEMKDDCCY